MKNRINEADFIQTMEEVVVPYIESKKETGYFERTQGESIYYEKFCCDNPKGKIVILHGFTEVVDKYREHTYYFLQQGYSVYLIQQRGHGFSHRYVKDPYVVYIKDYKDFILDLDYFVKNIVMDQGELLPLYLYAHSMGGAVAGLYLEQFPDVFQKAVLSAPMMEINTGRMPRWMEQIASRFMVWIGRGDHYVPGSQPYDGTRNFEKSSSAGEIRYNYILDLIDQDIRRQAWVTSYKMADELFRMAKRVTRKKECKKVSAQVLLFNAGKDKLVTAKGQKRFIAQIPKGRFIEVPDAKHEIFTASDEILTRYWKDIFNFLNDK